MSKPLIQLDDYVKTAFATYKAAISKFVPNPSATQGEETLRAVVHLIGVAKAIAKDFKSELNVVAVGSESLLFEIIRCMLDDGRVQSALGLTTSTWEAIDELPFIESVTDFNTFIDTPSEDTDGKVDAKSVFCC